MIHSDCREGDGEGEEASGSLAYDNSGTLQGYGPVLTKSDDQQSATELPKPGKSAGSDWAMSRVKGADRSNADGGGEADSKGRLEVSPFKPEAFSFNHAPPLRRGLATHAQKRQG